MNNCPQCGAIIAFADEIPDDGPPGPPPRHGLVWRSETQRWVKPDRPGLPVESSAAGVLSEYAGATGRAKEYLETALWNAGIEDPANPPKKIDSKLLTRRLAGVWNDLHDANGTPEELAVVERAMKSAGVEIRHDAGSAVPFDGETMFSPVGVSTGRRVKVIRPAVIRPENDGRSVVLLPAQVVPFGEPPPGPAPITEQVAIAGPDGRRAVELLSRNQTHGQQLLADLTTRAVKRLLASGNPQAAAVLFDDTELDEWAAAMSSMIATADLLGRARVRERARLAQERYGSFAEEPDTFIRFDEPPPVQPPAAAVDYFSRLVPELGSSAVRYGPLLDRFAFTLAHATDQALLEKVKKAILDELTSGTNATPNVQAILDAAGVSVRNPQYAEMVVRTNVMDAYNQGVAAEMAEPEMQEFFPVWRYDGILDTRTGDDHRPHIGKHYPSSVAFHEVRGPRVWNCRCSPTPISKWEAKGVTVESRW